MEYAVWWREKRRAGVIECTSGKRTWPGNLLASRWRLMRGAKEGLWGGKSEGLYQRVVAEVNLP